MQVVKTKLNRVLLIKPDVFEDHRGFYVQTYNEKDYKKHGINIKFIEDDISVSTKNVLRGIHGDFRTWKLVSCLYGKFYFVVVNCDETSRDFGKWESFILSDVNRHQVLVPPKFGNAHLVLSDIDIFSYKQSQYYDPKDQFTYKWNDPKFNIWWPIADPIISLRDEQGHF